MRTSSITYHHHRPVHLTACALATIACSPHLGQCPPPTRTPQATLKAVARIQRYEALPHRMVTLELALHHFAMGKFESSCALLARNNKRVIEWFWLQAAQGRSQRQSCTQLTTHSFPMQTKRLTERRMVQLRQEQQLLQDEVQKAGLNIDSAEVYQQPAQGGLISSPPHLCCKPCAVLRGCASAAGPAASPAPVLQALRTAAGPAAAPAPVSASRA